MVYIAKSLGLNEVANYWNQVIIINNHQRERFSKNILKSLYNTVAGKKIAFFGWSFKKDTNDTRESAAIYVADLLLDEMANIHVYDPKVHKVQVYKDLDSLVTRDKNENKRMVTFNEDPYENCKDAHAIAILTEWDEFKDYDWKLIFSSMNKPAFIFDGRNILDKKKLEKIGFVVKGIGRK